MQWIKASERMPTDFEKNYFVRLQRQTYLLRSIASIMYKDSKHRVILWVGFNTDSSHYVIDNVFEWLDEAASQLQKDSAKQGEEKCTHNWISSVAYKGARICSKCNLIK